MSIYKTDKEVEDLLNHPKNGLHKINVEVRIIGTGNHGKQGAIEKAKHEPRPLDEKADIAILANLIGNKATSEILDIHPAQVSNYKNGMNASRVPDSELVVATEKRLDKISDKALDKVEALMDMVNEDAIAGLKPHEIPTAIEKMAGVFEKVSKHTNRNSEVANRPSVVLYAPKQINITEYIVKEV